MLSHAQCDPALQVTPDEGEPVVVKLDRQEVVVDEAVKTKTLIDIVGGRAPRMMGDPVVVGPSPATHAILILLKAGGCIIHFWGQYRM